MRNKRFYWEFSDLFVFLFEIWRAISLNTLSIQELANLDLWEHEPQGLLPGVDYIVLVGFKFRLAEVLDRLHRRECLKAGSGISQTSPALHSM